MPNPRPRAYMTSQACVYGIHSQLVLKRDLKATWFSFFSSSSCKHWKSQYIQDVPAATELKQDDALSLKWEGDALVKVVPAVFVVALPLSNRYCGWMRTGEDGLTTWMIMSPIYALQNPANSLRLMRRRLRNWFLVLHMIPWWWLRRISFILKGSFYDHIAQVEMTKPSDETWVLNETRREANSLLNLPAGYKGPPSCRTWNKYRLSSY